MWGIKGNCIYKIQNFYVSERVSRSLHIKIRDRNETTLRLTQISIK